MNTILQIKILRQKPKFKLLLLVPVLGKVKTLKSLKDLDDAIFLLFAILNRINPIT